MLNAEGLHAVKASNTTVAFAVKNLRQSAHDQTIVGIVASRQDMQSNLVRTRRYQPLSGAENAVELFGICVMHQPSVAWPAIACRKLLASGALIIFFTKHQ